MSFNLNKNEAHVGPSKKSTFDLSKSDGETVITREPKKSRIWLLVLVALLVTGSLVWYITSQKSPSEQVAQTVSPSVDAVTKTDTATKPGQVAPAEPQSKAVSESKPLMAASFKTGSAEPQEIAKDAITAIKKNVNGALKISVLGYASSEGSPGINKAISQARADAYKAVLVQNGIAAENITAEGKGIENPIAPNNTEAGRAKNRRVEVSFH